MLPSVSRFGALVSPILLPVALLSMVVQGADWPTFRGPDRNAVSQETGLLQEWPSGGPRLLWRAAGVGRGYASLAVAEGRIYTLGDGLSTAEDKDEYLVCLDAKTGSPLWKTRTGAPWNSGPGDWQSSRSTPSVDGKLVCVVTPHGELVCCDSASGSEMWRRNLKTDFDGKKADGWGYSESPLIDGDVVVVTPGGDRTTMVALDRATGDPRWKAVREGDRGAGHASMVVAEIGGTRVYVQTTGSGALGVRAQDGKVLWSYPIDATTAVIPTPIVRGDLVFFAAGYGRGGALLRQVSDGAGSVRIEEVYGLNRDLANKHGGIVLLGDHLFGDTEDRGIPFCAELMTGEVKWRKRGTGSGSASIAAADGCLYLRFANGTVMLVKATSEDLVEAGSFKIPEASKCPGWSHPVIAGGRLYLREQDAILCYDIVRTAAAE